MNKQTNTHICYLCQESLYSQTTERWQVSGSAESHKTEQERQQFTQTWFSLLPELQEGKSAFESCRDLNELFYF